MYDSPRTLNAVLLYASDETRAAWFEAMAVGPDPAVLDLLVDTALSDEGWLLRARCLEVLGHVATHSDRTVAQRILARLGASPATSPT